MLVMLGEFTRRCLAIVVARRLRSNDVLHCLADLFVTHGPTEHIRSDNGPEFVAINGSGYAIPRRRRMTKKMPGSCVRLACCIAGSCVIDLNERVLGLTFPFSREASGLVFQ